jgi:TldD protein
MVHRRSFLGGSTLLALTGSGCRAREAEQPTPRTKAVRAPVATVDDAMAAALGAAKKGGASYADARVVRRRVERVATREDHVVSVSSSETYGIGVRVLVDGAWGFASAGTVDVPSAKAAADEAVAIARAAKAVMKTRVELAAAPVVNGKWSTAMKIDPFKVPLADKAQFLLDLWPLVKDVQYVKFATASFEALGEEKIFMSSEGSRIEQSQVRVWPSFTVTAVGTEGQFESRRSEHPPWQGGWDYVTDLPLKKNARAIAEDAVRKLKSPSVKPGKKDLVLAPSNLWLTIHESVGHPTELDRALLLEANLAGTSFVTPDKTGKLKYASPIVTLYADKTTPGGLATCGWDDDGVKTQKWNLVKDGLFVGWQTTREQAGWIGEKESRGTSYAQDHASVAFQRMPNVSLAAPASSASKSIDDLVAATDDGVLITGDGSWSIDHQRYNFQFSGQMFHEIKGGKITGTLRDVAYQSTSPEFWTSCDMIAGEKTWELHGTLWDGKGEPGQANAVSHGCPAARFRGVNILNVNARGKT